MTSTAAETEGLLQHQTTGAAEGYYWQMRSMNFIF